MTYPTDGDWWCEDSGRTPHRAPQGSLRCEVHAKEYKRYQDRVRAARARYARTHPGETYEPPPYAPTGDRNPASVVLTPSDVHELLSLRADLDAAIARVRRLQRSRVREDESALHLADLADRVAGLIQEFNERISRDTRARSPTKPADPSNSRTIRLQQEDHP